MNIITAFKGIDSSEALMLKTEKKFSRFGSILGEDTEIAVTYWAYGKKKVCDARVNAHGKEFFAKAHSNSFGKSLSLLKQKLKAQIMKERGLAARH